MDSGIAQLAFGIALFIIIAWLAFKFSRRQIWEAEAGRNRKRALRDYEANKRRVT